MKRSMFSAEQVVYALRQEEAGTAVEAVCRSPGVFVPWLRSVSYFQGLNQDLRFGCGTFTHPTQSSRLDFRVFCTRNPARMGGTMAAGQERPALDDG